MEQGLVVMIGSKILQNHVVCWYMELPNIGVADVTAKCSSGVKNYHVCDICYVTGTQDVIRMILFIVVHGVREQHVCTRWCVTRTNM